MQTYIAIRKTTRAIRRGGAAAAVGARRASLAQDLQSEQAAPPPAAKALADAGFVAQHEIPPEEPSDERASYEQLTYADAVVLQADDEGFATVQEALAEDYYVVPDVPLDVPTPAAASEKLSMPAAQAATDFWPEDSRLLAARADGQRGDGSIVVVLDTGCDADHAEFGGRPINFRYAPIADQDDLRNVRGFDTDGHGTHVSGIIRGVNLGLAPDAELLVAAVIESETVRTSLRRIVRALDWALQHISQPENQSKPVVLNMSLGFRKEWIDEAAENAVMIGMRQLLLQLRDDFDVLPVVAIGNDGADSVRAPGYFPETMAVGAVDNGGTPAGFSGGGPGPAPFDVVSTPDLVGFGVQVLSSLERDVAGDSFYIRFDGTSMATPYVSGIAALVASETGLQGSELGAHLIDSALDLGGPADRTGAGLARYVV